MHLEQCMDKALEEFKRCCTIYPKNIIIYRDGVSDAQRKALESLELPAIKRAIEKKQPDIKLVYITINKQINVKFF